MVTVGLGVHLILAPPLISSPRSYRKAEDQMLRLCDDLMNVKLSLILSRSTYRLVSGKGGDHNGK